jgi:hypothetical protein
MDNNFNFTYFTDYEKDKSVKIGVSAIVGKISKHISSHKAGWPTMIVNQLRQAGYENVTLIHDQKTDWSDLDVILIEHGMEFKGTFNIFGGANDELYDQVKRIFTKGVRIYSLHIDMPPIGKLIKERHRTGTEQFRTLLERADEANEICSTSIPRVDFIEKTDKLVFGDSHCFSTYRPGWMVSRNDGLTMHGALNRGLSTYVFPWVKELIVYMGNIDVRHHLMRQQNPLKSVDEMIESLKQQLLALNLESITLTEVLPIENVSRKIPKTGWYKKMPYFGTWEERTAISKYINIKLTLLALENGWSVYKVPEVFTNEVDELDFNVMEKPQSVHISREFHYWDYELNQQNSRIQ